MSDPVATLDDLATYLGIGADIDTDKGTLLLQLAHDKCEAVVSPVPAAARGVELDVAGRAYTNPTAQVTEAPGPYGTVTGTLVGGLWLTKSNIADLRRMASGTQGSGAFTVDPTPADAGAGDYWPQYPLSVDDVWSSPPYYGDWDVPPVAP